MFEDDLHQDPSLPGSDDGFSDWPTFDLLHGDGKPFFCTIDEIDDHVLKVVGRTNIVGTSVATRASWYVQIHFVFPTIATNTGHNRVAALNAERRWPRRNVIHGEIAEDGETSILAEAE